jgi:hypothetical protein
MATVITTARFIMTTTREPMVGMGALTVRTDLRVGGLVTILTRERTHEAVLSRLLMALEVQHKRIILTPAPMRRRDKVRVPQLNGVARTCREETRALPWAITRPLTERWREVQPQKVVKPRAQARLGEIPLLVRQLAEICMPHMTATFTKIPGTVGRSTTTGVGIR